MIWQCGAVWKKSKVLQRFLVLQKGVGETSLRFRTTAARISAKIEVEREVDTVIAGKKLEGKIMSVMPFFILAYLNLASGEFIDPLYGNLAGVLVMSAALLVFVGAMAINRRISDIRV